jgi:tyrosinase
VALPYWDKKDAITSVRGLPGSLLTREWTFAGWPGKGRTIPNPLCSYKLVAALWRNISMPATRTSPGTGNPVAVYSKPVGYATVRYPCSGHIGSDNDRKRTEEHNAAVDQMGPAWADEQLNSNVTHWLSSNISVGGKPIQTITQKKYERCLYAPNYTVFSNTTLAMQRNGGPLRRRALVALWHC